MDWEPLTLGENRETFEIQTAEENRSLAIAMAAQARRRLYILTRDLDPAVYDDPAFLDAVSRLSRASDRAHVHILVQDSGTAVKHGHRLIELAGRLSSAIRINRPGEEFATLNQAFLLADNEGYILRPLADRFEGKASFNAPHTVRELVKCFTQLWERSEPDNEIRRLHL